MYRSRQEIYTTVRNHLLTQKERSLRPDGCAYRSKDGLKCAIGCLIPDERYKPSLEGASVARPEILEMANIHTEDKELAIELQRCHDSTPVHEWESALNAIAGRFRLSVTQ